MNIKQKIPVVTLMLVMSLWFSTIISTDAFALTKSKFISILCDKQQGPAAGGGTLADACREDAKDGTLSKRWYDKTIKFSNWKDKTEAQLYRHIGQTPPSNDDGGGDETDGGTTNPIAGDGCGGVDTAIIKCSQTNSGGGVENNGIWGLLLLVLNIMTAGVGILAVGGIVYGAILYTTAEDRADQIKKATDIITNVVIGLVAFALMWAGLNFLIPGGVFS